MNIIKEALQEIKSMRLEDDIEAYNEYTWDDSDETLEDLLSLINIDCDISNLTETWIGTPFDIGNIVMTGTKSSQQFGKPHRLYVVDSIIDTQVGPIYKCYLLSSQIQKANINNSKYPYNILIKNYGSIIKKGPAPNKDAIIKLDVCYEFDNDDFDSNSLKGDTTEEFQNFIEKELSKIENGEDTSKDYWGNNQI